MHTHMHAQTTSQTVFIPFSFDCVLAAGTDDQPCQRHPTRERREGRCRPAEDEDSSLVQSRDARRSAVTRQRDARNGAACALTTKPREP